MRYVTSSSFYKSNYNDIISWLNTQHSLKTPLLLYGRIMPMQMPAQVADDPFRYTAMYCVYKIGIYMTFKFSGLKYSMSM